jgi:CheY-like chemotaxis protein
MTADGNNTSTVFLVDDDPDFLDINGALLEGNGYRVERFGVPAAALQRMAELVPDLVVSDLMMERFDSGFSFARQMKADERLRGVPVLIVTAVSRHLGLDMSPRTAEDLAAMGADAWLEKPVDGARLLATVRDLLGRARGARGA